MRFILKALEATKLLSDILMYLIDYDSEISRLQAGLEIMRWFKASGQNNTSDGFYHTNVHHYNKQTNSLIDVSNNCKCGQATTLCIHDTQLQDQQTSKSIQNAIANKQYYDTFKLIIEHKILLNS